MATSRKGRAPAGAPAARDLLRQVRRIELRTRGLVNSRFGGEYRSVFKGHGIEFAEVREYQPGDDVRTIDWNVTARLDRPFVKRYIEERELTVWLVADFSGSQRWGSRRALKSDVVIEAVATLAASAVRNNDRVGLVVGTDRVEAFVPPRKGRRHVPRLVRDLLAFQPVHEGTNLAATLDYVTRIARARSIIFYFSDFQVDGGEAWEAFGRALTTATARHDVVAVHLLDPAGEHLPDVGLARLRDAETGEIVVVDTSDAAARADYDALQAAHEQRVRRLFRRLRVDEIRLRTDTSPVSALVAFFVGRERRQW